MKIQSMFKTLLVTLMAVMGVNAQADPWTGSHSSGTLTLSKEYFANAAEGATLRITFTEDNQYYWSFGVSPNGDQNAVGCFSNWQGESWGYLTNTNSNDRSNGYVDLTLNYDGASYLQSGGLQIRDVVNVTITRVEIIAGTAPVVTKYTLTYQSQGNTVKTERLEKDAAPTPPDAPVRYDGYVFTGWKGLPEKMPEQNLTVTAQFTPVNNTTYEQSATYALASGESHTSGEVVSVVSGGKTVATVTYGEAGGAAFKAAKADGSVSGFTAFTEGNGENGNKTGGTFYTITPKYDGYVTVAVVLNAGKSFYVLEDGTAVEGYDGISVHQKKNGTYAFTVKAGKSYKVYCAGSKLGFYGFTYSYTIVTRTLTYYVDYTETKKVSYEVGETITREPDPTKEGYTFSGWSGYPDDMKMPNQDVAVNGTFSLNSHYVIYIVDGEEYKRVEYSYGYDLYAEQAPYREGYTFSGWSGFPDDMKMPDQDVTVTGSFTKNNDEPVVTTYTLTYVVDGQTVKTEYLQSGATPTPPSDPVKDGYTFTGWQNLPQSMPANNVTATAQFTKNEVVDNTEYATISVGATGYATYAPSRPVKFTGNEAVKAYIAKSVTSTQVTLTQVIGSVVSGTGLVLKGAANATATIEVVESGTNYSSENLLRGVTTGSRTVNAANQYVLVSKNGTAKFADTRSTAATVPAGKAYLETASYGSRALNVVFADDDVTAVTAIEADTAPGQVYNLSGQRVAQPRKGLYIVGGRKVVVR